MIWPDSGDLAPIALSRSQRNIYNGVLQDSDPALYLVVRSYRMCPLEPETLRAALEAAILANPVQLCVLNAAAGADYPNLVPRLSVGDIVDIDQGGRTHLDDVADQLQSGWADGILDTPLVRYVIRTDPEGLACGLDAVAHHILLDGGGTGVVEADLGRFLSAQNALEMPYPADGLAELASAHRHESARVAEAHARLTSIVRRELAEGPRANSDGLDPSEAPANAVRGVLRAAVRLSGAAYGALVALAEAEQIPINVLVATAVVAVDASARRSTTGLLIHAVDNRFGDPDLDVATCLVNSVAQPTQFTAFASVEEVARGLDRGYVRAMRRKWLREEHYRRIYLALNRTSHVEALTLNFLSQPCAPELRPHLSETPVTTAIGPVETTTVACVLDEEHRFLDLAVWVRADVAEPEAGLAGRIVAVLRTMPACWHRPLATTVDDWLGVDADGRRCRPDAARSPETPAAWFLEADGAVRQRLRGTDIDGWIVWLARAGVMPGDVLVFTDDGTDNTVALMIASHLAGCGYSVCDTVDELAARAEAIGAHSDSGVAHVVDVVGAQPPNDLDAGIRELVADRLDQVATDPRLAANTAYIMPTSGSTGTPKLVRVSHGALSLFCGAVAAAYGWTAADTILQCAPLTSDISIEEIFAATLCGMRIVRSAAMKDGDLQRLCSDILVCQATIVDLPTAVWQLLCDDEQAMAAIRRSQLHQVVVGGEAIRSSVADQWIDSTTEQPISLVSSYGPTEATVVATYLPIMSDGVVLGQDARGRLGRPVIPNSVFLAFGEVVIVGDSVASGYLGVESASFGVVTDEGGARRRAFATADRVVVDCDGFPVLRGRRDAVVKIAGRRIDTAEITRRVCDIPEVSDVAVEASNGSLRVWFQTSRTRAGAADDASAAQIRAVLGGLRVPSFFVIGVLRIPRNPNGKVNRHALCAIAPVADVPAAADTDQQAAGLAQVWSQQLGRPIEANSSLLDEGVGSLDLIRILPDTRRYLARHVSVLDLISADTAANLVTDLRQPFTWTDSRAALEIAHDLAVLPPGRRSATIRHHRPRNTGGHRPVVVLGASGILGTGFAEAILDIKRSAPELAECVLVVRSPVPQREPWTSLLGQPGMRVVVRPGGFGQDELSCLLDDTNAATLVNCVGNTNVLVPYGELRAANVELVSAAVRACAGRGTKLVHLSTFVVNGEVSAPRIVDPRDAPYPYAASKAMAELIIARSPAELDFTIARLPRVLGGPEQMAAGADILVAVADACAALHAHPATGVTEDVTTARAAARAILAGLPDLGGSQARAGGLAVVHGQPVAYREFLAGYGGEELDAVGWKQRLDGSDWARRNPRRWSAIDAWFALGMQLGSRTYAEYLAELPGVDLQIDPAVELVADSVALPELLQR